MKYLFAILASTLLAGCATNDLLHIGDSVYEKFDGKYLEQQANLIDQKTDLVENKEVEESRLNFSNSRAAMDKDLVHNPYLENYLNSILDSLVAQWPHPLNQHVQLKLTTDRSYNAFATKDTIVMSYGVAIDADSEDEIAFILAHELSHIILAHSDTNEYFAQQSSIVSKATNIALISNVIGDLEKVKTTNGFRIESKNAAARDKKLKETVRIGMTINRLSRDVISSSMTRTAEDEADLLGIDLMVKAGYTPTIYKTVLERLESSLVFTNAQLKEKKEDFQSFVTMASDGGKYTDNIDFQALAYLAANEATTRLLQSVSTRHNSPEDRKKDLAEYIRREYRRERNIPMHCSRLHKTLKNRKSKAIMQNYWNASEAMRALENGEIKIAEGLARKSVSGITSGHAYPRLAFYSVRRAQGNMKKAAQNLSLIKNWDTASIQTFNLAAEAYRQLGKPDHSEKILAKAEKIIGIKAPFYPEYIRLYKETKRDDLANSALTECVAANIENIISQCYDAAGIVPEKKEGSTISNFFDTMTSLVDVE